MEHGKLLYEGKAKKVFETANPEQVMVYYKDDATALNGLKKGSIEDKGEVNNQMSNRLFELLEKEGIKTHYVEQIDERSTIVRKVDIVPIEVVMRNIACGSLSKRLGLPEGQALNKPIIEYYYKDDELGDPMIAPSHIDCMGWATDDELAQITRMALKVNDILTRYFDGIGVILVDFKLEFGRSGGEVILADEISPDTCRLWDKQTLQRLDKDLFRRDMGGAAEAYQEMLKRVMGK